MLILGVVLFGTPPATVAGQDLYDAGIMAAAGLERIYITGGVAPENDCSFGAALLMAEAERTFRRDRIASLPLLEYEAESPPTGVLLIRVNVASVIERWCALNLDIQLQVVFEPGTVLLAADAGMLLLQRRPEHVVAIRRAVEQNVSVISNAIRRARGR